MSTNSCVSYTIGDLVKEFDLTRRTINFYVDIGILQPQEQAGPGGRKRIYSPRDRARLRLALRAKRIGLSLNQAKELIDMYDSPRDTVPQLQKFLALLGKHERDMKTRMADLKANLEELKVREAEVRSLLIRTD